MSSILISLMPFLYEHENGRHFILIDFINKKTYEFKDGLYENPDDITADVFKVWNKQVNAMESMTPSEAEQAFQQVLGARAKIAKRAEDNTEKAKAEVEDE